MRGVGTNDAFGPTRRVFLRPIFPKRIKGLKYCPDRSAHTDTRACADRVNVHFVLHILYYR